MTDNERQLLEALARVRLVDDRYVPPSHVGGTTGSPHATTLARMTDKGWVERRRRFEDRPRAGWEYRLTAKGRQALANDGISRQVRRGLNAPAVAEAKERFGL